MDLVRILLAVWGMLTGISYRESNEVDRGEDGLGVVRYEDLCGTTVNTSREQRDMSWCSGLGYGEGEGIKRRLGERVRLTPIPVRSMLPVKPKALQYSARHTSLGPMSV